MDNKSTDDMSIANTFIYDPTLLDTLNISEAKMSENDWNEIRYMNRKYETWGDYLQVSKNLVYRIEEMRIASGNPITLTCNAYSASGHSKKSQHAKGNAADWRMKNITLIEMWIWAEKMRFTGIGLYPHGNLGPFMHTDVRPLKVFEKGARWIAIISADIEKKERGEWDYIELNDKNLRTYVL